MFEYSQYITYRIAQLSARLNSQASQVLKKHGGLNVVEWRILALVQMSGPVHSATLVKSIGMDAGLFSRNLKSMIERGLVSTKPDKNDNRRQILRLTSAGRKKYQQANPAMAQRRQQLTTGLTTHDKATLFRLLDILDHNASEPVE